MLRRCASSLGALRASPALGVAALAWLVAAVALVHRVPIGSGIRDEAYYSAITYGFVLGDKPYSAELASHQHAAYLVSPLYRVYVWARGTDGIILFNRWLYAVYVGIASYLTYRVGSRLRDRIAGCWAAAILTTWSYFNLLALSYNTQGALGLCAGALLGVLALFENRKRNLFLAGVCLVSSAFCYPPLLLVILVYLGILTRYIRARSSLEELHRALLWLVSGMALAALPCAAFIAQVSLADLHRAFQFAHALGYGGSAFDRLNLAKSQVLWPQRWYYVTFGLLFASVPFLSARLSRVVPLLVVAAPLALLGLYRAAGGEYYRGTLPFATMLALLAPVSLALCRRFSERGLVFALLWVPGAGAMAVSSYASANGLFAANLGAPLPTLAGVFALSALLAESGEAEGGSYSSALFASFCAGVVAVQIWSLYSWAYDGVPLGEATTRVEAGPNRGTLTSAKLARFFEALHRDLKSIEAPGKTLLMFENSVAAYLSTGMRARTFTHWVLWSLDPEFNATVMEENYRDPAKQPDFVLLDADALGRNHPWRRFEYNYQLILERPELGYRIEKRVRAAPLPPRKRHRRRHPRSESDPPPEPSATVSP